MQTWQGWGGAMAAVCVVLANTGCANNAQLGTGVGAVVGGVVGDAVIGNQIGKNND